MSEEVEVQRGSLLYGSGDASAARLHHNMQTPRLYGHEDEETQFINAWMSGRLPHGWLMSGPKGIGKMTLACRFARFVLANHAPPGAGPSGLFDDLPAAPPASLAVPEDHPVYRRAASGGHGDLHILERRVENNRRQTAILVEAVRTACQALSLTSAEGGWRIVIIDDAETMNSSAFNALLKVLEEPPSRSLLILVAHAAGRLPPTVRSRCCEVRLSPLSLETVNEILEAFRPDLNPGDRLAVAALSDGSIGQALRLSDGDGPEIWRDLIRVISEFPSYDIDSARKVAVRISSGDAEDNWESVVLLISRCLASLVSAGARHEKLERFGYSGQDAVSLNGLLERAGVEVWLNVWDKVQSRFRQVTEFNLDKRQAILDILGTMAQASDRRS